MLRLWKRKEPDPSAIRHTVNSAWRSLDTIAVDVAGKVLWLSEQVEHLLQWQASDLIGQPIAIVFPGLGAWIDRKETGKAATLPGEPGSNKAIRTDAVRRDGASFPVELTEILVTWEASDETVFFVKDRSDVKALRVALAKERLAVDAAKAELEEVTANLSKATSFASEMADKAKTASKFDNNFLYNLSREIRTPLNSIAGITELLRKSELHSPQQEFVHIIESSSKVLFALIDDMVEYSKIAAGKIEPENTLFNLWEFVESVTEIFGLKAQAKGLDLLCFVEPAVPQQIFADPVRLRRVLVNLLDNAIKMTKSGQVALQVLQVADETSASKTVTLHFKVNDTGAGFSAGKVEQILNEVLKVEGEADETYLGLYLAKMIVNMMGGDFQVESTEGVGSSFHFKLVVSVASTATPAESKPLSQSVGRAFIVNKNDLSRQCLAKVLEYAGLQVSLCSEVTNAYAQLQQIEAPPAIILVAHDVRTTSTLEFLKQVHTDSKFADSKVFLITPLGGTAPELMAEYGVHRFISKPVKQSALLALVHAEIGQVTSKPTDELSAGSQGMEQKNMRPKILLVEDNKDNQILATKLLERAGYDVAHAENGLEAIESVRQRRFDAILMDIYMPEMDGFEATTEIRKYESDNDLARVPIIACTAHAIEGYREKCLEGGMDDFITKPIRKTILIETIGNWVDTPPSVLVVDDAKDNLVLMKKYFQKRPECQVFFAENGEEAVASFKAHQFSLILMDMEMPVLDGYTATAQIRKIENGTHVPIVALTAHSDETRLKKCLDAGCTATITKPIRKELLFKIIDRFVGPGSE